jgi:hypothetical protein
MSACPIFKPERNESGNVGGGRGRGNIKLCLLVLAGEGGGGGIVSRKVM